MALKGIASCQGKLGRETGEQAVNVGRYGFAAVAIMPFTRASSGQAGTSKRDTDHTRPVNRAGWRTGKQAIWLACPAASLCCSTTRSESVRTTNWRRERGWRKPRSRTHTHIHKGTHTHTHSHTRERSETHILLHTGLHTVTMSETRQPKEPVSNQRTRHPRADINTHTST